MKFKFDSDLLFQKNAISAVVDIFEGQSLKKGDFEISFHSQIDLLGQSQAQMELGVGNRLETTDALLNSNIKLIQKRNNIHQIDTVDTKGKNFTVEMETGTGKTYVYLRTAFELNKKYGFKKFIIVVPSVAIREGVLKSIEMMREHLGNLYNNMPFNHFVYDSKKVNELRGFAMCNEMQIMIINIDSFNKKDINIIHDNRDKMDGRKPIEFIQATNPIIILDEPQNMESDTAKEAISSLNPLCTLRYSATHRDKYNLVYQLDPIKAFQMRLVKKISVASVIAENDPTSAYIKVNSVNNKNGKFTVGLSIYKKTKDGPKISKVTFKKDDDLFVKSAENETYKNGFIVSEINARPGMEFIKFANGIRLGKGDEQGGARAEIVKEQIRQTIKAHFDKEVQVKGSGLKVLSLFFLDKVENYRVYTEKDNKLGQYGIWFEEIYKEMGKEYSTALEIVDVNSVHNGYFSKDKRGHFKDSTSGTSKDDEDTYSLIMREKEKLLSLDNPLKFIFSHSALREGWDNPNVFQICTLSTSKSTLKKRQEIGRGLRLPVNQNGDRVYDEYINNLVVIANESYDEFASTLQKEFEEDCGVVFGRLPVEAFVGIPYRHEGKETEISKEQSEQIWDDIKDQRLLGDNGFIKKEFIEAVDTGTFNVKNEYLSIKYEIIKVVENHQIENHIENYNKKVKGQVNEDVLLDPEFIKFWEAINMRTIYSVDYSSDELINKTSEAIMKMVAIKPPKIRSILSDINITSKGVKTQMVTTPNDITVPKAVRVPDILSYIQEKTELTRDSIYKILNKSQRLNDFQVNPQLFMDMVVNEVKIVLNRMIVDGIKYERLEGITYEMTKFREDEHKLFFQKEKIIKTEKSVFDYIMYDSRIERKFAENLEKMRDIKYFIKLPSWFKVPTPVGEYNPDWAILKQNGDIVYLIRETKGTREEMQLRMVESDKIKCGRSHFETIGVDYDVITSVSEL